MDKPNAAMIRRNVEIGNNERADIHVRMAPNGERVGFVAVYVRPNGPVPGYWFTNLADEHSASDIARALWAAGHVIGFAKVA